MIVSAFKQETIIVRNFINLSKAGLKKILKRRLNCGPN